MTEILKISLLAIIEHEERLSNCSFNLILGSKLISSNIPTEAEIILTTTNLSDDEKLTFLIKQHNEIIAKALVSLRTLRQKDHESIRLESMGAKADTETSFSWEVSFEIDKEVASDNTPILENPFSHSLQKTEKNLTPEDFGKQSLDPQLFESQEKALNEERHKNPGTFAAIPADSQSLTHVDLHSPTKMKLDFLMSSLEEKLRGELARGELSNVEEVNELLENLKASVAELQKDASYNFQINVHPHSNGSSPKVPTEVSAERFIQTAPNFTPTDFVDQAQFHKSQPISGQFYNTENMQNVHLKVPEALERNFSQDSKQFEPDRSYASDRMSRRTSKQYTEAGKSLLEDVKIEKNEDYLLTMRNQLTGKNLGFINDAFTRDIILYMAQSKKKISAIRLRRSITIGDKEDIEIEKKEYFNTNCTTKFIHFFQANSKILYLYNLVQPFDLIEEKARKVNLNIDFEISAHHKSVITPAGMIFIAGGKPDFKNSSVDAGSNTLHLYNYKDQSLVERAHMNVKRRSEFGLCYMSKNLFVVGGVVNGQTSAHCERYDIRSNKWVKLASMSRPLREVSICSFNNRYIYRIFGIDVGNNIDHSVERYDAVRDSWMMMNTTVGAGLKEIYLPFVTQISPESIFVFGGKNIYGFSPKSCMGWVLKIEEKRGSNNADLIESRNFIPGLAGSFNQNSVLTHAGDILFLRDHY